MRAFDELFLTATGRRPHDFQERIARDGLPGILEAPPDTSRSGVVLAWLWRRLSEQHRDGTPRRLVYALPQRGLTERAAGDARQWLANLGLTGEIALRVVLGGRNESHGDWQLDMHQPAIVIGPADVLVSKLLNRAYDTGPVMFPINFALTANGAHWVMHETRLCPRSAATLRQVAALAGRQGTAEPFGVTFMTAPAQPAPTTMVVLDTTEAAQSEYRRLRGQRAGCTLLHSGFRGIERAALLADIAERPGDRIIVTTRAVAASLDVPATDQAGTVQAQAAVIGPAELVGLFDTLADTDIAPYARDSADLDVEVAWATWTPGADGAPDPEVRMPPAEYRCRVSPGRVAGLAAGRAVWRYDPAAGAYATVGGADQPPPRPYELFLVSAADGGYDPETGFDPAARGFVAGSPALRTSAELEELTAAEEAAGVAADDGEAVAERHWQSLDEHSEQVRDQVAALVRALVPHLPEGAAESAVVAGYLHDLGKAHEIWQDALCALAPEEEREMVAAGRPWAKSGGKGGRLEFAGDVPFRHELASLLLADGPLQRLLAEAPDQDLCRFLILAHHGKLRVHVRDDGHRDDSPRVIRGLAHGATSVIPPLLAQPATRLTVDLDQFGQDGDEGAWTGTVRSLLDRYGPFRLAYLETLVRVADWRASAGAALPAENFGLAPPRRAAGAESPRPVREV
jgi:CRISPR-associated endonuclease Cas3-HD